MSDGPCRWCERDGWHENTCPNYRRNDGFSQASAFHEAAVREGVPPPTWLKPSVEPESMQIVASNHHQLEQINHDLNDLARILESGEVRGGLVLLSQIQQDLYSLLR